MSSFVIANSLFAYAHASSGFAGLNAEPFDLFRFLILQAPLQVRQYRIVYLYSHYDKQGIPGENAEKARETPWRERELYAGLKATVASDRARDAVRREELAYPALSALPEGQAAEVVVSVAISAPKQQYEGEDQPVPPPITEGTSIVRPVAERVTDVGGNRRGSQIPVRPIALADLQRLESSTMPSGERPASVWKTLGKLVGKKDPPRNRRAETAHEQI